MKIIHIADFGKSGNISGVGEAVLNLAKTQISLQNDVRVVFTRPNHNVMDSFCHEITTTHEFRKFLQNEEPELVIFHSFYDFTHPRFARILRSKNIPYLITFHGGASTANYKRKHFIKWITNIAIFKPYIRKALAVIYLNENELQNSIFQKESIGKFAILPNGITLPHNIHTFSFNPKSEIIISFISRLNYIGKGLDVLLPAIRKFENELERLNVRFRFYGYHYNDGTIEKIRSTSHLCEYYGYVRDNEKDQAFLNTDIMILPSRSEGMPISILESLSFGVPCIITPQTNMGDLIGSNHCGWITELTIDAIAKTILVAVKELKENHVALQQNCLNAVKLFEWSEIGRLSIKIYKSIMKSNSLRYG